MPYDRYKDIPHAGLQFNAPPNTPVDPPAPRVTTGMDGALLGRSVEIMETWSLLFGPATIECAYAVDGHVFIRLTNGRLLVDPEEGAGLVISNHSTLS